MNIAHPTLQARDIASLIDNDPIMASQIKEFMRIERLIDCLGLQEALDDSTLIREVVRRGITAKEIMDAYEG